MNIIYGCAIGAVICLLWFFLQWRLFDWADNNPTLLRKTIRTISLLGLSTAITLIGFTLVAQVVSLLVSAMFGAYK